MGKSVSKLGKEDLKSLREATYFDKRELQQWYKGFLRDAPSGVITEPDLAQLLLLYFPFGDPTEYTHLLFQVFDADDNKTIDFKEFIIALSITLRGTLDQRLQWTFKMYDYQRQGIINYQQVLTVIKAVYKMVGPMVELPKDEATPEARAEKFFVLLKKNPESDSINLDEFRKLAKVDPTVLKALSAYEGWI